MTDGLSCFLSLSERLYKQIAIFIQTDTYVAIVDEEGRGDKQLRS